LFWLKIIAVLFAHTPSDQFCHEKYVELFLTKSGTKAGLERLHQKAQDLHEKSEQKQKMRQHELVMSELKDMYGITQEDYDQAKKDIQEKKPLFIHGLDTLAKQLAIARSEKKALELITYLMKTQTYYKRSAERVYLELSLEKELMETRTDQYPEESLVHEKYENYVNAIVALRKHGLEFEANQIVERLKNQLPPSP
jgi:hypothetical protein